jgi:hypothetical protein
MATLKPSPSWPTRFSAGHADVVEDHVADVGALLAHLLLGLADRKARQRAVHQEGRDPAAAFDLRVGARHTVKRSALLALVMKRLAPFST